MGGMMTSETLEFIKAIGAIAFIAVVCALVFLNLTSTWSKKRNEETEAQKTIREELSKATQKIDQLEKDWRADHDKLDDTERLLTEAQNDIERLEGSLEVLKQTNVLVTTERDQMRTQLNTAQTEIDNLRLTVARLEGQLTATETAQTNVVDKIVQAIKDISESKVASVAPDAPAQTAPPADTHADAGSEQAA